MTHSEHRACTDNKRKLYITSFSCTVPVIIHLECVSHFIPVVRSGLKGSKLPWRHRFRHSGFYNTVQDPAVHHSACREMHECVRRVAVYNHILYTVCQKINERRRRRELVLSLMHFCRLARRCQCGRGFKFFTHEPCIILASCNHWVV